VGLTENYAKVNLSYTNGFKWVCGGYPKMWWGVSIDFSVN